MATRKYRSAESLTPVASHEEMRRYPKTGIISPEFRLYVEGISIPFISISISESFRGMPTANIEIPYFAGLTEICKNYAPKVNIFFRDIVYEKYLIEKGITDYEDGDIFRTLFDGVMLTSSYSRSKSADGGSAQVVFSCVHKYSFLNQILLRFGGRGVQAGSNNQPEASSVSNYMNSSAAILESLSGLENTTTAHVNEDISSVDSVNIRALSPDLYPYYNRLIGITGVSVVLWNTFKRDSYVLKQYTKTMTDMYIPLVDGGLKFFKRMTGHPIIERGMETERYPISNSEVASRVQGLSPISSTTNLLIPANYRNFVNEAVAIDIAISLTKTGSQATGETTSLYGLIQSTLENMIYDLQVLASPIQSNDPKLEGIDSIVKPLLPFYFAPTCNVLLPHMYSSISIQDGANLSPTRLVSFPDVTVGVANRDDAKQEFRAPHSVRLVTALNNPLGETTLNASTVRHGEYPAPHEFGRGMLVKEIGLKPWIKHLYSAYSIAKEREETPSATPEQTTASSSTNSAIPVTNPPSATKAPKTISYKGARVIDVAKSPKEDRPEAIWKHWDIRSNPIPFYYGSITKKGTNVVYGKNGVATPGSVESISIETFRNTTKVPSFWNVVMFPYNSSMYAYPPHYDYIRRQWFAVDEIPAPFKNKYTYVEQEADSSGSSKLRAGNPPSTLSGILSQPVLNSYPLNYSPSLGITLGGSPESPTPTTTTTTTTEEETPYWEDPILDLLKRAWDRQNPDQWSLNPYATTEENGSQPYEMTLMNTLDYEFSLALVENKQGSVEGLFNPYIVPGYPMDIIDPSPERPSYHAFCIAKTHSITPRSCSTSITFSSALSYDELRSYELPSILPWFQKQLHFIDKQTLINQSDLAKQAANTFYFGVLGCGYADPTLMENDETNSVNFLKVNKQGDFEVTVNKANLSELGSMDNMALGFIDQNLSYEGNLALVRREIETLSDIEASRGIRFVDVLPDPEIPLPDVVSKAEVSALRPDVLLKPGRSVFLNYDRLDAVLYKGIEAKLAHVRVDPSKIKGNTGGNNG